MVTWGEFKQSRAVPAVPAETSPECLTVTSVPKMPVCVADMLPKLTTLAEMAPDMPVAADVITPELVTSATPASIPNAPPKITPALSTLARDCVEMPAPVAASPVMLPLLELPTVASVA